MISNEVFKKLKEQDWDTIVPNLLIHAHNKIKGKNLPGYFTSGDFIGEVYEKVYIGERKWDPEKDPDLLKYLKSAIDSLIYDATKLKDSKLLQLDLIKHDVSDGEDLFELQVSKEIYENIYDNIIEEIKGDDDLELLFMFATENGNSKPGEIKKELGWDKDKTNNVKKRLKRLVMRIKNASTIEK